MTFSAAKYGEVDLAQIAELWAAGVSTTEIGRRLNVPKNSVCRLARNARLRSDPRFPIRQGLQTPKTHSYPVRRRRVSPPPLRSQFAPSKLTEPPLIFELQAHECKFPVLSGTVLGDHRFCAAPRQENSPYCAEHHALCNTGPYVRSHRARAG